LSLKNKLRSRPQASIDAAHGAAAAVQGRREQLQADHQQPGVQLYPSSFDHNPLARVA